MKGVYVLFISACIIESAMAQNVLSGIYVLERTIIGRDTLISRLTGIVVDSASLQPLPNVKVGISSVRGDSDVTYTDSTGSFVSNILPPDCDIVVVIEEDSIYSKTVWRFGTEGLDDPVQLKTVFRRGRKKL